MEVLGLPSLPAQIHPPRIPHGPVCDTMAGCHFFNLLNNNISAQTEML